MTIHLEPIHQAYLSFLTKVGILTIDEGEDGSLNISLGDYFNLHFSGKDYPEIVLDSQEKPAKLKILQSESQWIRA